MDLPLGKHRAEHLAHSCHKTESVNGGISANLGDDKKKVFFTSKEGVMT